MLGVVPPQLYAQPVEHLRPVRFITPPTEARPCRNFSSMKYGPLTVPSLSDVVEPSHPNRDDRAWLALAVEAARQARTEMGSNRALSVPRKRELRKIIRAGDEAAVALRKAGPPSADRPDFQSAPKVMGYSQRARLPGTIDDGSEFTRKTGRFH